MDECAVISFIVCVVTCLLISHSDACEDPQNAIPSRSTFEPDKYTLVKDENGEDIVLGPRGETWIAAVDFDDDCDTDILAGNGGYVYLLENKGSSAQGTFATPRKLTTADGSVIDKGYWSGAPAFTDMNGDGLKDLLLSEWDGSPTPLSLFINTGTASQPTFGEPKVLISNLGGTGIRFDVADWNGDGLKDIIVGPSREPFAYYPNEGTAAEPTMGASAVKIQDYYTTITQHYPRVVDWNGDGNLKIVYSGYYPSSGVNVLSIDPDTKKESYTKLLGSDANIGDLVGYRLSSDISDFNADGIADIVVSGKKGKVVIFWGKEMMATAQQKIDELDAMLTKYSTNLGTVMETDDQVCKDLQSRQDSLLKIANYPSSVAVKDDLFGRLSRLVSKHPNYLHRQQFSSSYLAYFSYYTWVIMLEGRADTRENRHELAEVTNHIAYMKDVLTERGLLVLDNDKSSQLSRRLMRDYTLSLRPGYFWMERIGVSSLTGPVDGSRYSFSQMRKGGVNIFSSGASSATYKAILPGCKVCKRHGNPRGNSYVSVLAHEIGHNFVEYPGVNAQRYKLIRRAIEGNADIFWRENDRYDVEKTKKHFEDKGWYDPKTDSWNDVLKYYFQGQFVPEAANTFYQFITNSGPQYVGLTHTQEFFASIAQCFSHDSKMLMDIAIERFLLPASYKESINQILFLVEYYSLGENKSRFWIHTSYGLVDYYDVDLERNAGGKIVAISVPKDVARKDDNPQEAYLVDLPADSPHMYRFAVDEDGYVTAILEYPAYINP